LLAYLKPSSGYGGSCFPKDVQALRAFARHSGRPAALIDAVASVNEARNDEVMAMAEARIGAWRGRKVTVLGLAFKAGTDDLRHSPALNIVQSLLASGALLCVHDPVATDAAKSLLGDSVRYAGDPLSAAKGADVLVIGTAWPAWRDLDWRAVQARMRGDTLFDPRNALRGVALPDGMRYLGIGVGAPSAATRP
jgi:nucleotide sugar dehydrogenase